MVARWIGRLGKAFCALGALVLLFVGYQLWGTGLRTARAQSDLEREFVALKDQIAATSASTTTTAGPPTSAPGTTATAPPGTASTLPSDTLPGETAPPGVTPTSHQPVGRIEIPKIGASFVIVEGTDVEALKLGPGHFPETPLPGQPGNAAIAGHRTTFLAPFNRIDELRPGDPIDVETTQGHFTYLVEDLTGDGSGHEIVLPTQTEILNQHGDDNTLTLMACHPKHDLVQRIVVVGKLVEPAAPKAPPTTLSPKVDPKTGQPAPPGATAAPLLESDSSWLPTVIWGLVAADVWLAAWLVARRWRGQRSWRPWAVYGAALPLFAVALFFTFEGINALLPAGY